MPKVIDHTGKRFGKLVVLGQAGKIRNDRAVKVLCDCGVEKVMVQTRLTMKHKAVTSCGCMSKINHVVVHGLTNHPFYPIWRSMMGRCYGNNAHNTKNYGDRGIGVCKEWRDSPKVFINWLEANGYRKGLDIDRIDNDEGYSPANCRCVTRKENMNNTSKNVKISYMGKQYGIPELVEISGLKYATIYKRISNGLEYEGVINQRLRGAS